MSALSKFRVEDNDRGFVLQPFTRPSYGGVLLSVDQSLNASGWSLLEWRPAQQRIVVVEVGTIKTETDATGHQGTLEQGSVLYDEFDDLLSWAVRLGARSGGLAIVHEHPFVARPGLRGKGRHESSLVAANSLRCAARVHDISIWPMISAQTVKNRLTGDPAATKADIKVAIETLDPSLVDLKPMNEHIRDSIANGWVALERGLT